MKKTILNSLLAIAALAVIMLNVNVVLDSKAGSIVELNSISKVFADESNPDESDPSESDPSQEDHNNSQNGEWFRTPVFKTGTDLNLCPAKTITQTTWETVDPSYTVGAYYQGFKVEMHVDGYTKGIHRTESWTTKGAWKKTDCPDEFHWDTCTATEKVCQY